MNIDQAKQEIIDAVRTYLEKDETGRYEIPVERQRPILLMGPPGIGKTAVMEQIAHELGIGLVSYTITHHTRQSAIGLPTISDKIYDGKEYKVTEYTMSEIIGAVYDRIENSGIKEGILFLDEINCVSETLAPTMLQFLQYKTFGSHKLPEGYIIVTAGNPPQYNKSVRDFDIVTLDRVRKIEISEDFEAWKNYAYKAGVHGSIMSYLEIKKDNFYSIKTDGLDRSFVTARGWEDLSRVIRVSEKLGIEVNENLTVQYLQNKEIARDFADYYELYNRYNKHYRIPDILSGAFPQGSPSLKKAPFDEKLSIIGLLTDKLMEEFRDYALQKEVQKELFEIIKNMPDDREFLVSEAKKLDEELESQIKEGLIDRSGEKTKRLVIKGLLECEDRILQDNIEKGIVAFARTWFRERENKRLETIENTGDHLENALDFLEKTFGNPEALTGSQEMVIFLTELTGAYHSLKFIRETGHEAYYKYNRLLMVGDRRAELQKQVEGLLEFEN